MSEPDRVVFTAAELARLQDRPVQSIRRMLRDPEGFVARGVVEDLGGGRFALTERGLALGRELQSLQDAPAWSDDRLLTVAELGDRFIGDA